MADKIRVTVVFEYEPDMSDYEECADIHEAARLDEDVNHFTRFPDLYDVESVASVTYEGVESS